MRAAGLFRVSDFRLPRAFVCARVSSFCVSGCTVFCKRWVFRSARRGLIPCFRFSAAPCICMRAGFLILRVGLHCISQAVGFPFCAPRAYSVFFACRLSVPAFCAYTGRSVFCGRAAFSSFCKRCGSLAALRVGKCGALSSVTLWHLFPEGAGRIWNRPRATAEHGHGAPCFCKGENTGTALRVFARERTRARRFVFLQGREHGHGAPYFCKGENTGTALCVFARERTRARRSAFLQGREHGRGVPYVCKGKEYGRCVPHLCTRTVSAFVHGRGIRR